jgi:hypothetical protein
MNISGIESTWYFTACFLFDCVKDVNEFRSGILGDSFLENTPDLSKKVVGLDPEVDGFKV